MTAPTRPAPATGAPPDAGTPRQPEDDGLTVAALLDLLEEPAPGTPLSSSGESMAAAADAAAPRVEAAARAVATAAGAAVLFVLVPLAALVVVTAEKAADAIAAADLPGRVRAVEARVPGWVEQLRAWSQRGAQWVLGPQGIWTDRWTPPTASARSS